MFRSKSFDKIVARVTASVEDLRALAAAKYAESNDHHSKAEEHRSNGNAASFEAERAERVAVKLNELIS